MSHGKYMSSKFCKKVEIGMSKLELEELVQQHNKQIHWPKKSPLKIGFGGWAFSNYLCEVEIKNEVVVSKTTYLYMMD